MKTVQHDDVCEQRSALTPLFFNARPQYPTVLRQRWVQFFEIYLRWTTFMSKYLYSSTFLLAYINRRANNGLPHLLHMAGR